MAVGAELLGKLGGLLPWPGEDSGLNPREQDLDGMVKEIWTQKIWKVSLHVSILQYYAYV